jgi:hypothetical protein
VWWWTPRDEQSADVKRERSEIIVHWTVTEISANHCGNESVLGSRVCPGKKGLTRSPVEILDLESF